MGITQEPKRHPNIVLPDFESRIIYVSSEAQNTWEPRFQRISNAFLEVEKNNILHNVRDSYLTNIQPEKLFDSEAWASQNGLKLVMLAKEGMSYGYSSLAKGYVDGEPYVVRCAFTKPKYESIWKKAWENNDNETIGKLLGFPTCCRNWFVKYWQNEKYIDDILPMYMNSNYSSEGPWQLNFYYRYLGIRLVSHMPCSFRCEDSLEIANKNHDIMLQLGYVQEYEWIKQILNWPVRWSSLHGIAEIRTPIFKLSHKTDYLEEEFVVDKQGAEYPIEGASGTVFPWVNKNKAPKILSERQSFKDSLKDAKLWEDNGFSNEQSMRNAHEGILSLLHDFSVGSVLDLGCGNGELLKQIKNDNELVDVYGIEQIKERVFRANKNVAGFFSTGDIFNQENYKLSYYNMVIFMPGRLVEINKKDRKEYIEFLNSITDNIVLYVYGDWIEKYDNDILKLLDEVGIKIKIDKVFKNDIVHAIKGELI